MEVNAHTFTLTNKQEAKLVDLVNLFYARASKSNAIPTPMLLLLGGVRRAILDKDSLEQPQMDVVVWMLELLFEQMQEDEYDPQMEQIFQKLTGFWPTERPWYERIKD